MTSLQRATSRPHGKREWRAWAAEQEGLSPAAIRLLHHLALHATPDGVVRRTLTELARDADVSAGTYAGTLIKRLVELKLVKVISAGKAHQPNAYMLDPGSHGVVEPNPYAETINPWSVAGIKARKLS